MEPIYEEEELLPIPTDLVCAILICGGISLPDLIRGRCALVNKDCLDQVPRRVAREKPATVARATREVPWKRNHVVVDPSSPAGGSYEHAIRVGIRTTSTPTSSTTHSAEEIVTYNFPNALVFSDVRSGVCNVAVLASTPPSKVDETALAMRTRVPSQPVLWNVIAPKLRKLRLDSVAGVVISSDVLANVEEIEGGRFIFDDTLEYPKLTILRGYGLHSDKVVRCFPNLRVLSANFGYTPTAISHLTKLERVDVRCNGIEKLPPSIKYLKMHGLIDTPTCISGANFPVLKEIEFHVGFPENSRLRVRFDRCDALTTIRVNGCMIITASEKEDIPNLKNVYCCCDNAIRHAFIRQKWPGIQVYRVLNPTVPRPGNIVAWLKNVK